MHPDLPSEQAYFDRALALRDRQQAGMARAPRLAANPKAAIELRKRVSKLGLADPDEAIAFGRIQAAADRWYIGKGAIWDDDNELVVVNWQAPIAAPFYTATPDEPEGLDARRLFRCSGNQIREIEDLVFKDMAAAIATGRHPEPVLSDALLDALGSARSGELADIVATIQAAQYEVISCDLDQLLVVQGGPGTGKTVVGLHRVSWLLFNRRDRLEANDVLIVGPNPAFVHYISSVLPSLGEEAVVQVPLRALGPRVRIGRVDPPDLRRLKGDRRMLRLILRGMRNRQRIDAQDVELKVEGRTVRLDGRRIATRARQLAGRPHNESYRMLRAFLVAEVRAALARLGERDLAALDIPVQGESAGPIDDHLAKVWPSLTPQAFLVDLLSSRRQLLGAGAGTLAESELEMLALPGDARVGTWQWSVDDVPLLDAADALLNGVPATYEHIVVDEAQDLSPLQLESIRRRSRTGSMTVLGDLAQATSPWAHQSWEAVASCLRRERVTASAVELEYGYRLPAEVHEVAMRLLPEAAPGLACPHAVRASGHEVEVVPAAGDLVGGVMASVRDVLGSGIVGVIVPPSARAAPGGRPRRRGHRLVARAAPGGGSGGRAHTGRRQGPGVRRRGGGRAGRDRRRVRARPAVPVRGPDPLHQPAGAGPRPAAARGPGPGWDRLAGGRARGRPGAGARIRARAGGGGPLRARGGTGRRTGARGRGRAGAQHRGGAGGGPGPRARCRPGSRRRARTGRHRRGVDPRARPRRHAGRARRPRPRHRPGGRRRGRRAAAGAAGAAAAGAGGRRDRPDAGAAPGGRARRPPRARAGRHAG